MQILFEKVYGTYSGSTTQIVSYSFLKRIRITLHIIFFCMYVKKLNKVNCYDLNSLFVRKNEFTVNIQG